MLTIIEMEKIEQKKAKFVDKKAYWLSIPSVQYINNLSYF